MKRLITALYSMLILTLVVSCEQAGNGQMNLGGASLYTNDMPPRFNRSMGRLDINEAVSTLMNGPTCCNQGIMQEAGQSIEWEEFVANSQRAGDMFDGPFGRVEFYNGSARSLPGGGGITSTGNARYLDESILDILPLIALAHRQEGLPTRVSSTTGGRHSSNSLHYHGRAIDIDPDPASRKRDVAERIRDMLAASGRGCGYFVLVEPTHIHVSYKGSGYPGCPGYQVQ